MLGQPIGVAMAKPRVFISSTFYDLRQVREDLERMIRELGYEPVRHETGRIPYAKDQRLETSAYREVELCDVIVSIVGGRFGTESKDNPGISISQAELRRALDTGIQVFVFVEKSVLAEYSTYQLNKAAPDVKYGFVDDVRVYEFLEHLYALPQNNPIHGFETSLDITDFLRQQWAGLFHRFLQDQRRLSEVKVLDEMNATAKTLRELVTFLTEERKGTNATISGILLANHPAFRRFTQVLKAPYRIFFDSEAELQRWLSARGWEPSDPNTWDEDSCREWENSRLKSYLKLSHPIFEDDGRLKTYTAADWNDDWVQVVKFAAQKAADDDDVPF
jgi:Domain of unknown function (DUF4062)